MELLIYIYGHDWISMVVTGGLDRHIVHHVNICVYSTELCLGVHAFKTQTMDIQLSKI